MTRHVHLLSLSLVGALALGACVDGDADAPMRIIGNVVPASGCVVDSSSNTFYDDGVIQTDALAGYIFTPSVVNEITLRDGEARGPKTIYVTGARVEIDFYDPAFDSLVVDASLLRFQVPVAGAIDPGGGKAAFSFEVVPQELVVKIGERLATITDARQRTVLDVRIQMVGTKGGGSVQSNVFRYPVEVCIGCLQNILMAGCEALPQGFSARTGGACQAEQDGVTDCCNGGGGLICPAVAPSGKN